MKRAISLLLLVAVGLTSTAQVSRTWVRQSSGVPTVCPSRTITINTLTDILYVPNGSGGCDAAASASSGIASINGDTTAAQTISATDASITVTNAGATHSIGLPYKVYTVLLTQSGTDAPTAVVLQNTLGGTPTLARTGVGAYTITLTDAFTSNKTVVFLSENTAGGDPIFAGYALTSTSVVTLRTFDTGASPADALLSNTTVEIRVYPA